MSSNVLTWGLNLDSSGFHKNLNKAAASVQETVGKGFGDLIAPVAKVTAAVGSVAAIMKGITGALDLGSELTDMSNRTGIAVESLVGLKAAFKDAGVDAQALGPAVNKMQKGLASAVNGGAEANVLKAMGLDPQSLASMDPGQAFAKIGNSISQLGNPTERAAASMAIFGKSGAELLQVFMDPNFKEAGNISNKARLLGENAAIFDKASDALGHVSGKISGFFVGLASGFVPLMGGLIDQFEKLDFSGIGAQLGAAVGNFYTNFDQAWKVLGQSIAGTFDILFSGENLKVFGAEFLIIASKFGDSLLRALKVPLDYLEAGIQKVIEETMAAVGKIPVIGSKLGLKDFKASSFDQILADVQARGNGVQNWTSGNSQARQELESGMGLRDRLKALENQLSATWKPVLTPTDATKEALATGRAKEQAARLNITPYNGEDIGMGGKASIISDSLAKVGGGGFSIGPGNNPILEENKRQTNLLQQINRNLSIRQGVDGSAVFDGLTA